MAFKNPSAHKLDLEKKLIQFQAPWLVGHWMSGTDQLTDGTWISQYNGKKLRYLNFSPSGFHQPKMT